MITQSLDILNISLISKRRRPADTQNFIAGPESAFERMFPSVRVSFSGLQLKSHYWVLIDVSPVDNNRYRYAYHRSSWLVAGKADIPTITKLNIHPDCVDAPFTGEQLQRQCLSFEKVKLTNNTMEKGHQIVLNSMHKYQPRIHLVLCGPSMHSNEVCADDKATRMMHLRNFDDGTTLPVESYPTTLNELYETEHRTFKFAETSFIAVTAYQNQLITKLKIESNPFAKGFRDTARLTDFDRSHVERMIQNHTYARSPLAGSFDHELESPLTGFTRLPNFPSLLQNNNIMENNIRQFLFLQQQQHHFQQPGIIPVSSPTMNILANHQLFLGSPPLPFPITPPENLLSSPTSTSSTSHHLMELNMLQENSPGRSSVSDLQEQLSKEDISQEIESPSTHRSPQLVPEQQGSIESSSSFEEMTSSNLESTNTAALSTTSHTNNHKSHHLNLIRPFNNFVPPVAADIISNINLMTAAIKQRQQLMMAAIAAQSQSSRNQAYLNLIAMLQRRKRQLENNDNLIGSENEREKIME